MADDALRTRLDFIGIDDEIRGHLRELRPLIGEVLPGILDGFYATVERFPATARFFKNKDHMRHARDAQ